MLRKRRRAEPFHRHYSPIDRSIQIHFLIEPRIDAINQPIIRRRTPIFPHKVHTQHGTRPPFKRAVSGPGFNSTWKRARARLSSVCAVCLEQHMKAFRCDLDRSYAFISTWIDKLTLADSYFKSIEQAQVMSHSSASSASASESESEWEEPSSWSEKDRRRDGAWPGWRW